MQSIREITERAKLVMRFLALIMVKEPIETFVARSVMREHSKTKVIAVLQMLMQTTSSKLANKDCNSN